MVNIISSESCFNFGCDENILKNKCGKKCGGKKCIFCCCNFHKSDPWLLSQILTSRHFFPQMFIFPMFIFTTSGLPSRPNSAQLQKQASCGMQGVKQRIKSNMIIPLYMEKYTLMGSCICCYLINSKSPHYFIDVA